MTVDTSTGETILYVGGNAVHTQVSPLAPGLCENAESLTVGRLRDDGTNRWRGVIDDLRIWSVVRTPAEICTSARGTFTDVCVLD